MERSLTRRWLVRVGWAASALLVLVVLLGTGIVYEPVPAEPTGSAAAAPVATVLRNFAPRQPYIVIDRVHNRLYVYEQGRPVFEALCSTGSGMMLTHGQQTWTFETPRGQFKIRNKQSSPWWRKPDWAFIEEGKPVPDDPADRFESGVLGEYAMDLGDGYSIHGTLYERLLGRSVTHGCIRVGRDDLRQLNKMVRIGTPVYIF